jgi:hypothetical protein
LGRAFEIDNEVDLTGEFARAVVDSFEVGNEFVEHGLVYIEPEAEGVDLIFSQVVTTFFKDGADCEDLVDAVSRTHSFFKVLQGEDFNLVGAVFQWC